jgi:hypothetical protein
MLNVAMKYPDGEITQSLDTAGQQDRLPLQCRPNQNSSKSVAIKRYVLSRCGWLSS